ARKQVLGIDEVQQLAIELGNAKHQVTLVFGQLLGGSQVLDLADRNLHDGSDAINQDAERIAQNWLEEYQPRFRANFSPFHSQQPLQIQHPVNQSAQIDVATHQARCVRDPGQGRQGAYLLDKANVNTTKIATQVKRAECRQPTTAEEISRYGTALQRD